MTTMHSKITEYEIMEDCLEILTTVQHLSLLLIQKSNMGVYTLGVKICTTEQRSYDSVTSIVGRMWTRQSGFQFPAGARDFSLLQRIHTCLVAHAASCSVDSGCFVSRHKTVRA